MQTAQAAPPPPAAPPPRRPPRWLPLIGLLAVMGFTTFGGFFFSGSSPETAVAGGDVEVGAPIEVAQGVTIQPADGWEVVDPIGDPEQVLDGVILSGGNGSLLVGVFGATGTPEELAALYVSNYLEPYSSQLSVGEPEAITLPAGNAVVVSYVGVFEGAIEGEVIAIVSPSGTAVLLDGWSSQGAYGSVQDQIVAMTSSVVIP